MSYSGAHFSANKVGNIHRHLHKNCSIRDSEWTAIAALGRGILLRQRPVSYQVSHHSDLEPVGDEDEEY
jgi:hypothetical protein